MPNTASDKIISEAKASAVAVLGHESDAYCVGLLAERLARAHRALHWITRCARFHGPVGLTLYAISDSRMNDARHILGLDDLEPLQKLSSLPVSPE